VRRLLPPPPADLGWARRWWLPVGTGAREVASSSPCPRCLHALSLSLSLGRKAGYTSNGEMEGLHCQSVSDVAQKVQSVELLAMHLELYHLKPSCHHTFWSFHTCNCLFRMRADRGSSSRAAQDRDKDTEMDRNKKAVRVLMPHITGPWIVGDLPSEFKECHACLLSVIPETIQTRIGLLPKTVYWSISISINPMCFYLDYLPLLQVARCLW
jgi:hypothetical protein